MSSADYYLYQEAVSSPEVSLSAEGRFSSSELQLVLARRNLIQLYDLDRGLKLVSSCPFQGVIKTMAKLVHSSYETDLLILGFEEAKIVTMVYDPLSNSFATVALHSFEREEFSTRMTYNELRVIVDPEYRCVLVMLPYGKVGVLPLKTGGKGGPSNETDSCYLQIAKAPLYGSSFMLELSSFQIQQLLSAAFTPGSTDPTVLLVASEVPGATISSISRLTINLKERRAQVTLKYTEVPPDIVHQLPLPPPLGGQLLICGRSLIHDKDGSMTTHQLKADLEGCAFALFDPLKLILGTKAGETLLVLFNCFTEGEVCYVDETLDTLKQVLLMKLPLTGQYIATQLVPLPPYLWFASRLHDSFLYRLLLDEQYLPLASGEIRKVLNHQTLKIEVMFP